MGADLTNFLDAQSIQTPMEPDISFLAVGHIDELVSYCPDGTHVLTASTEVGWALMVIANGLDPAAMMLQGIDPFGAAGTSVATFVAGAHRTYNVDTLMNPVNIPDAYSTLGVTSPVSTPAADAGNTGTAALSKGGGLVGFFPNNNPRTYRIEFTSATDYTIEYQESGVPPWHADGTGTISIDVVSTSRTGFILHHWWSGTPVLGDKFTFTVDPTNSYLEIPVLFHDDAGALALTNNNVNSLIDGNRIVSPQPWGPHVDLGSGPEDIFEKYVEAMFTRAGYTNIVFADERVTYHNQAGSIHCGTNSSREIPSGNWWE